MVLEHASATRSDFFIGLAPLPPALRRLIEARYAARLDRACGRPLLGEYAPVLLADLLGLQSSVADRFTQPIMNVYAASLIADDMFDRAPQPDAAMAAAASALLVQRGMTGLFRILPAAPTVDLVDDSFVQAARSALSEVRAHRARIQPYSQEDVTALGDKGALLKLAARLMLLSDGRASTPQTMDLINDLLVGVQLLDDLTDWEEDWNASHYTLLLTLAAERAQENNRVLFSTAQSAEDVLGHLVTTGALEDTIQTAREHLARVLAQHPGETGSVTKALLSAILRELGLLEVVARTARIAATGSSIANGAGAPPSSDALRLVQDRLQIVAQES